MATAAVPRAMTDRRIPPRQAHRRERDQFRCLVCRRMVNATDHGACPNCGNTPPTVVESADRPDPMAWREIARDARKLDIGPRYWLGVGLFSIAVAVLAATLAVKLW